MFVALVGRSHGPKAEPVEPGPWHLECRIFRTLHVVQDSVGPSRAHHKTMFDWYSAYGDAKESVEVGITVKSMEFGIRKPNLPCFTKIIMKKKP